MRLLAISAPLGVGVALACVPLILQGGEDATAQRLQLVFLPLLCVLFLQAALAWTASQARLLPGSDGTGLLRRWSELLLLAVALTGLRLLADLWLRRAGAFTPLSDWADFLRMLPFSGLVQPLFLVLGVYAFAVRLGRYPQLALVAVVLVHQTIVLLQFGTAVPNPVLAVMLVLAGLQGLVLGSSYLRYGPAGPVLLSLLGYARHALYLLEPALGGAAT